MATKISIVSRASNLLGKASINDLEANPTAAAMAQSYDSILPNLISQAYWGFARRIDELDQINETPPVDDYTYQLQLPPGFLAIYRFWPSIIDYVLYGDRLYTNETQIKAAYTVVPTPDKFPAYFVLALEYAVAADCAMLVTQDSNLFKLWDAKAMNQLAIAMSIDAKNYPAPPFQNDPIYRAHFGDPIIRY